jgi:hypothetical protein
MGGILDLTNTCINILNHIGDEMGEKNSKNVVMSNSNISLITD